MSEEACWEEEGYAEFNSSDFFDLKVSSPTDLYTMMSVSHEYATLLIQIQE